MLICFEQFVFHQWRLYDYDRARQLDYGVYDRSNVPITRHNEQLFTMLRTEVNFSDFAAFVAVDVGDVVRDKKEKGYALSDRDMANFIALKQINETTVFSRA